MKQTIILGNIITMDPKRPTAKAAVVKDGMFAYIGEAEIAKQLAGQDAIVLDYGVNFIYPGFLESHCHSYLAGDRAIGQANLAQFLETDYAKYREVIRDFIEKNPQRTFYMAAGWIENDEYVSKAYLDEICADKPLLMQTGGGHSMLGCIEDAEKITGDLDQRNVLAHLHFVTDEDIRRMAATGSVPAVPPLWTPKEPRCLTNRQE